jgi:hypothetical protein
MLARLLVDKGVDVEPRNLRGQTPAYLANGRRHLRIVAMLKAKVEATRRAKCVAFAMGHHPRLGAGSWVQRLDPEVVRMVLEKGCPRAPGT